MARNAHGGNCIRCGLWVSPGTGHFRREHGKWVVHHANFKRQEREGGVTCQTAATKPTRAAQEKETGK